MKLLLLGLALVGSLVVAQVRMTPEDRVQKMQRSTLLLDKPIGQAVLPEMHGMHTNYSAETVQREGNIVKLSGHVRIATGSFILYAETAEYNTVTGEIDAHGEVHVKVVQRPAQK